MNKARHNRKNAASQNCEVHRMAKLVTLEQELEKEQGLVERVRAIAKGVEELHSQE